MSLFGDIGNALSSVAHTVENTLGEGLNLAEGAAGEIAKLGEGAIGGALSDVLKNPLDLFNPFAVLTSAAGGLFGALEGSQSSSSSSNPFNPSSSTSTTGDGSSVSVDGGSSIEAVLLELASKERGALADKVTQLKNLQVPGKDASPQDQANYDSTKTELMADIQSIQNSIQQITTMATNVQKNENDTNMSVIRNMGS